MSRRSGSAAEAAASAASEAARVLQQRSQEVKAETREAPPQETPEVRLDDSKIERLRQNRTHPRVMDEIVRSRPGYKEEEAEPKVEAKEDPAPKPEQKAEPAPEPAKEAEAPPVAEQAPPPAPEPIKTIRVKVDGDEFDALESDVTAAGGIHAYQREKASENRLKKANEALAEAQRLKAQLADWAAQQQAAAKPKEPEVTDDEFLKSKVDALRFGSAEESAAALREILHRTNKPVDQNALIEAAAAKIKHDAAVAEFDREFSDLVSNPFLLDAVNAQRIKRIQQMRQEGVKGQIDWKDFYFKIGHDLRNAIGRPSQPSQASAAGAVTTGHPSQGTSDKEARKASIVNLPAAAARAEAPKEEVPETREQIIQGMRRARGLPVG